jgi:DNA-directed RNA polymerase subunit RPC12/RpoP
VTMSAITTHGACAECGEKIDKIEDSSRVRFQVRFQYPEGSKFHTLGVYCAISCESCGSFIDNHWRPNTVMDREPPLPVRTDGGLLQDGAT